MLDTAVGVPASGMLVEISRNGSSSSEEPFQWEKLGECWTNSDGRGTGLIPACVAQMPTGIYMMKFHTKEYFARTNTTTFYPYVEVVFQIEDPNQHYHIPLLLSPYGYSTYRGS